MRYKAVATVLALSAAAAAYDAAIPYFARSRTVTADAPATQDYLIVDADVWKFSRPDLADVRQILAPNERIVEIPMAIIRKSSLARTSDIRI